MRRLLILSFLFCLLSLTESVNAAPNTISQTELDLKLELQKKDIDANKEQTAETKAFIKEELNNQKEYNIDSRKYISDKAENINWWLAAIGIVVTLIGVFSAWRVVVTENDVKDKIKEIIETAQNNEDKMMEYIANASKLNEKIKEYEVASSISCSNVKQQEKEVNDIVKKLPKSINNNISPGDPQKIEELVSCVNLMKSESKLTANDWLLKGYDAYINKDFSSACFYYNRASQLDGNRSDHFNLWGNALFKLAEETGNKSFFDEAISKYEESIRLNPNDDLSYSNLAVVLMSYSKLTSESEQNKPRIEEVLFEAEKIKEGAGSYNLACLYSFFDEKEKALEWLERNLTNIEERESRETIEKESDFDLIKEDPRFVALLNRYYPQ